MRRSVAAVPDRRERRPSLNTSDASKRLIAHGPFQAGTAGQFGSLASTTSRQKPGAGFAVRCLLISCGSANAKQPNAKWIEARSRTGGLSFGPFSGWARFSRRLRRSPLQNVRAAATYCVHPCGCCISGAARGNVTAVADPARRLAELR